MSDEPTLTLHSDDLLSKWGFGDGDTPDHLMDHWDEIGVDYNAFDWHDVLRVLVRRHLVPALELNHTITVGDIETAHNPVRATLVDGVEPGYPDDRSLTLTPPSVTVAYSDVMAAIQAVTS